MNEHKNHNESAESEADERFGHADRGEGLSALAKDAAHPFDQTNGLVDGLQGDADDPETVNEREEAGDLDREAGIAPAPFAHRGNAPDEDADDPQGP